MSERRAATKGRRLGSSRRKQLREGSGEPPAPGPGEEPPWASEIVQGVQHFLSHRDTQQAGVVTRSDIQKLQEEGFPCSREELELVFDGLDAAGTGQLGTEEFTAGLRQFLSSQKAAREHRRRKTASRRVRLVLPVPALEGVDSEERRHFAAFMEQLGTDNVSEEQEIWQLWVKLRQDEPQLLDNLQDFLAKMRHRIQEARSEKEALELTLNKRVAEHDKDVQQLCEVLEQQIQQEQLRLQQQSMARSRQQGEELQRVLDASEREVQRLVTAQMELERRCRSLHSSQQVTSTENRQLEQSNRALEDHLQHLHQQLQQTQGHLRTMRATVAWEHTGEPGDSVVAELPIEVPVSPQLSPGTSEKFRSEMRIRLGSQSGESKAKRSHQVVWEMLPAEINISGAPRKASSAEEDPFPESLKEEGFSDQSSLLREMNDAIAALSKHLKEQGLSAPPALADTPCHPWDNAEPQMGPEAATAHGTTPGVPQVTVPGHVHHELLEGDLEEEPATAELRAPDVTQAGASTGAGHCTAQEPGAEQGESPEEAQRMLFLQGKGAGVQDMVLKVAENLGESAEAGELVLMEVEGAGRLQEKTAGEKPQLLGEAEEVEMRQGENLEAGLGPPEAGQEGVAVGQCLVTDELQPGGTPGECEQEHAELASGLPEKLETELGEHLEPEPPPWGEAQVEAAHGDGVPEVPAAPGLETLDEDGASTGLQPQGETAGSEVLEVLPARAERAGSSRAGGEEEEVEEAEPREAEQQLQGECARGGAGVGGSAGAQELLVVAVPPTHGQEGAAGTDVEGMEAQSSTNTELLAEVEADLQVSKEARSPGTRQGGGVDSGVQLEKDKPELGLGEETGAAAVHSEGPSPAETPEGSPDLSGLVPVKSQALELVEADLQLCGGLSPETPQGGKSGEAGQLQENEEEDGAQEQGERGLPHEQEPHPNGVTLGQGEGAGEDMQAQEEAESLDTAEDQSTGANVQLIAEGDELSLTLRGSTETDLQLGGEAGSLRTEQGGNVHSHVQALDQVDEAELVEMEAEDAQEDLQLGGHLSPGALRGEEGETAVQLEEEDDGAQGQGEHRLPHEPEPHPKGVTLGQGDGAGEDVQAQEEAESLDTAEHQSTGANVQLIAEGDELKSASGESTEADLQPFSQTDSLGTEQGGSVAPEVQPLDQVGNEDFLEMEAEDAREDLQLGGHLSPGALRGEEGETAVQLEEEEDGAQGQGEHGLPHEPEPHPNGVSLGEGDGAGAGLQAQEEAESLGTAEHQSTGALVQLIAEGDELRSASGESTEADLQPFSQTDSLGTEQGGSVAPDVQPLDQEDKEEILEMEAEDAQADLELCVGLSPETPRVGESGTAVQIEEEKDGAQEQGEHGLSHEPVPHPSGVTLEQGEGAAAGLQPVEEAVILATVEDQSTGALVQLIAEVGELNVTPGGSTEADLQLVGEAGSSGTEQGGRLDSDVQPLDQEDKAELETVEAEDVQEDRMFQEGLSPGTPWGEEDERAVQMEEEEDGAQGQGEHGLPHKPVLDLQGSGVRQGEGAGEEVQAQEEGESLGTAEHQSTGANVQLIAEGDELKSASGESTEADLQPFSQTDSLGTEQGGSVAPEVQPLDQVGNEDFLEMEAEDAREDLQLGGHLSPGALRGEEGERAVQLEEEEDGAQGQGEHGLPHEPEPHPNGVSLGEGDGAGAGLQAQEEAESLDTAEHQSTGALVQLIAEGDELKSASGESTEADLQPFSQTDSLGTEQGGSVAPDVQPLDQVDEAELVAVEAEDSWTDSQLCGCASPETAQAGGDRAAVLPRDGAGDWGQGQGGHGLVQELVPHPSGVTISQRRGTGAGVQPVQEAVILATVEDQSTGANVQLIAEGDELSLTLGGSTEADLQLMSEVGSLRTEQGGSVAPDVQPLDQVGNKDFLEMEAEDAQEDLQLGGGLSPGTLRGEEGERTVQVEEEEDGAQGQGEHGLPHEPEPHPKGVTSGQGDGAGAGLQAQEEAESLDTTEDQSTGALVQLIAEADELKSASGESTEADLQLVGEAGSPGTEQGGRLDPDVQSLDQEDKEEVLEMEVEDAQEDLELCVGLSPETPRVGESGTAVQIEEEEDGAQEQGEHGLSHEPVPHPSGVTLEQGEGAAAGLQPVQEAVILATVEDQSTGALIAEVDELSVTPAGGTEADLQLVSEAGSPGTEQGGRLDPDVQSLDQENKEILEIEVEDAQEDLELCVGLSPETPRVGESGTAVQLEEEKDGAQEQGEHGLSQEAVLDPQGARGRQGEGPGAGVQPQEEAESLDALEAQSTDGDVQLFTEQQEPTSGSGGSTEADLTPLGAAGMWEGGQSLTPGLDAGPGASPTANPWEGGAAAHVAPPAEAALCAEPVSAAQGPGLEAKLGACMGPEGQILEAQELLHGERALAEGKPLDGAHGLEVAQGERLEAGVRIAVKTQGLEPNQGCDDAVPALASLVSEVPLQTSTQKLGTMMQEDVLVPDVWRLCAPGQAAQGELQEQVSAQGHEGRLHTVALQPEGETLPAMEPERAGTGAAEPPKHEEPAASALHPTARAGDAGSDQLGMVLRENSLGQRQPLGEQSEDLSVGQREATQEFGEKMSQEGEPSAAEPGAVPAGGAGAPRGCPKAALEPEHLYNVLFVGDSHVGKTSFLYRLHADTFNPHLSATVGLDYQIKNLVVDNKRFALRLWDSAGQERYHSVTKQFFRRADGVVLMYDITSACSFADVRYWLSCIQEGAVDGVAVLLLGNKSDCAAQRQVPEKEGECLAKEHQLMFYECSAASGHNVFESMVSFIRLLKAREDEFKNKAEEVPKAPQKKKNCCW